MCASVLLSSQLYKSKFKVPLRAGIRGRQSRYVPRAPGLRGRGKTSGGQFIK